MKDRLEQAMARAWRRLAGTGLVLLCLLTGGPAAADEFLTGQMLVSVPEMQDPNFARTVVYMLRHDDSGALGLVINRPLGEVPLTVLLEGKDSDWSKSEKVLILSGGPVNPKLFISLHSRDLMPGSSTVVNEELAYTSEQDVLKAIEADKAPKRYLFALGYSGWAPDQLESELERGDWFVIPGDLSLIFEEDRDRIWEAAVARYTPEL
jgi:putative transcriptional regulator